MTPKQKYEAVMAENASLRASVWRRDWQLLLAYRWLVGLLEERAPAEHLEEAA